jgi:TPP-dependent indolepyruvate ferredoxin oxidoreductase alpha subunit
MAIRRQTTTTGPPGVDRVLDPFAVGSYLTRDGALLGIVGELPQKPSLLLVEDCHTLEITVVSADVLREQGAQPVAR